MNSKPRITRSSNVKNSIALEKSKHCIVRLEDIKRQRSIAVTNSSTPQQNKARPRILVSSAIKKTPLQKILPKVPQSAPPRQQHQQQQHQQIVKKKISASQEDDLDSIDLSSFGRSRRTPKPNIKYFNDSVVTIRPGKKLKIDDEEDEVGDGVSSDVDFEDEDDDKEENVSDFEISEDEEEAPPAKKTRLSTSHTQVVVNTSRPTTITNQSQNIVARTTIAAKPSNPQPTRNTRTIVPVTKMPVKKPTILPAATVNKNKPTSIVTYTGANNRTPMTRKRPLETTPQSTQRTTQQTTQRLVQQSTQRTTQQNTQRMVQQSTQRVAPPQRVIQQSAQRGSQQTPQRALAARTASQPAQRPTQQVQRTTQQAQKPSQQAQQKPSQQSQKPSYQAQRPVQQATQKPVQRSVNNSQSQAIKPKPATNVTNNASGKSYTVVRRSTAAAVSSPPAPKKEVPKKVTQTSPSKKKPEVKASKDDDNEDDDSENDKDNLEEDIGNPMALNTIDDFEAMPTFTIVNINDIINKKGDVLMQQTFPKSESADEKKPEEQKEGVSKNRRKATHTVLKEEPSTKSPPPKTPFPPIAPKKVLLSPTNTGTPLKQIVMNKKIVISPPSQAKKVVASPPAATSTGAQKPPVRILNSTLCRQQTPVSPIINAQKQQQAQEDQQQKTSPAAVKKEPLQPQQQKQPTVVKREPQPTPIIKTVLSPNKQPINNNTIKKQPVVAAQPLKRKLPEEKITVQRQGTKTIKKMTCFENWYVVHCPENQTPLKTVPNQLTLPLIRIANTLQEICLPSAKWTSKVALSLIPDLVFQRGQFEKYTGNYHDKALVKDEVKHRYQPASILFRRAQKPNAIDRTVILKNRTYLIYIQGKAVQLLGSPKIIKDLQDIESLLDCVDHLALDSDDVDITPAPANPV